MIQNLAAELHYESKRPDPFDMTPLMSLVPFSNFSPFSELHFAMQVNQFEPKKNLLKNSQSAKQEASTRFWIYGMMLAQFYWHFQLLIWVTPSPNKWDMGGIAGTIQFAIFVGFLITTSLLICMTRRIDAARLILVAISVLASTLGVFVAMTRKSPNLMNSGFVHEIIYVVFNSTVSILLLTVKHFRGRT